MVVFRASEWALKKFIKFILTRLLSKIIGNRTKQESLQSIDFALSAGTLELTCVELNTSFVQELLFSSSTTPTNTDEKNHEALSIASATCGKIKIKIPWNNLYTERCELVIEDVSVQVIVNAGDEKHGYGCKQGEEESVKMKHKTTRLHFYNANNDSHRNSVNVMEINRAIDDEEEKEHTVLENMEKETKADEFNTSNVTEKTAEPGAIMKAIKRLLKGGLVSIHNVVIDFVMMCESEEECTTTTASLLIENGTYVHEGRSETGIENDVPASSTSSSVLEINIQGMELRIGESQVISPFDAKLSKSSVTGVTGGDGSSTLDVTVTYSFSVEDSVYISSSEHVIDVFSRLKHAFTKKHIDDNKDGLDNEEDGTYDGENNVTLLKSQNLQNTNKSFLECILEKENNKNTDETENHDIDEFYDCEQPASENDDEDVLLEKFSRSIFSSFYEQKQTKVISSEHEHEEELGIITEGKRAGTTSTTSSTTTTMYDIKFVNQLRFEMRWEDGSDMVLTLDTASRIEISKENQKLFAPHFSAFLQVNDSSPLLTLEIVSDEVLPLLSFQSNSSDGKRNKIIAISSTKAALFLDGETLLRVPELAHLLCTFKNERENMNREDQYTRAKDIFMNTTLEILGDCTDSVEEINQLARVSSLQFSMSSTRVDIILKKTIIGRVDSFLRGIRHLPESHPLYLRENELGVQVHSFSLELNIDSLDVIIKEEEEEEEKESSEIKKFSIEKSPSVFSSASEKLSSSKDVMESSFTAAAFLISFSDISIFLAHAVCGDQDSNFTSLKCSRIVSVPLHHSHRSIHHQCMGKMNEKDIICIEIFTVDKIALQVSKLPIRGNSAGYAQQAISLSVENVCANYFGISHENNITNDNDEEKNTSKKNEFNSCDMRRFLSLIYDTFVMKTDKKSKNEIEATKTIRTTSSIVVAMSTRIDLKKIKVSASDNNSKIVMELNSLEISAEPSDEELNICYVPTAATVDNNHEIHLQNVFATHKVNAQVNGSFTLYMDDAALFTFREDTSSSLSQRTLSIDIVYSPTVDRKTTVTLCFLRACDFLIHDLNNIRSIRSILGIMFAANKTANLYLTGPQVVLADVDERDEKDLEYVFIKQPHKRRVNVRQDHSSGFNSSDDDDDAVRNSTLEAMKIASKGNSRFNSGTTPDRNDLEKVRVDTGALPFSSSGDEGKKTVLISLSLIRSNRKQQLKQHHEMHQKRLNMFGGDDDDLSRRFRFLPLPLNAPKSSTVSFHAFAKSVDVRIHNANDSNTACKGLRVNLQNISSRCDIFENSARWGYYFVCEADEFTMTDLTPSAIWPNIYSRYQLQSSSHDNDTSKNNETRDIQFDLTGIRCDLDESSLRSCEIALKFLLKPARVRLDQKVVKMLLDFSEAFKNDCKNEKEVDSDDDFCVAFENGGLSNTTPKKLENDVGRNEKSYFQVIEIAPWFLRLDYYANENVDVYALTAGNYLEALNLIPWGGVSLEFPAIHLVGISGAQNVFDAILSRLIDCVTKDQAHKFVKAFAPVASANRMTSAAKDIYKNPMAYKQRKGEAARSARMFGEAIVSTAHFCKAVSLEALKLGEFVSGSAAAVLEAAEQILDGEEMRREMRTERDKMPDGVADGVRFARDDFVGGVIKAKNAIVRDPMRKFSTPKDYGGGAKSAAKTLIKNAPRAGVAALSGASRATNKVIVGVKNSFFPSSSTSASSSDNDDANERSNREKG